MSDIATAPAAGRDRRRAMFAALDARSLGEAAPLWLGAVRDIDDVLPAQPGLFDLVVLDEASQIDQTAAAGALLRAKRAVVCGDPRQLRHVSFISDDDMKRVNDTHLGPGHLGLDIRRESIFDVASRAGNGFQLDEHYRCDPHLIDFSARRFYQHSLHVATATPLNHDADHIEVRFVEGSRNDSKINGAQTTAAEQIVSDLIAEGVRSIGIITPFRDQADAMTERILRTYRADEIEDYGIAVGTVHAFQGAEHQVVIAMLTLGPEEAANSWRFVNDANLFNVMVTRARRRMIVLTSDPAPPGLAGEYLIHADPLSRPQETVDHHRLWPSRVASALADTNLDFWPNYYVGKHRVDFALIRNGRPTALTVEAHPHGPAAHAERELALRRLGWDAIDGFESRWGERLGELAVTLG
ncbi:MAG: ATP-binding protein [Acidimicrobiales bacterium]